MTDKERADVAEAEVVRLRHALVKTQRANLNLQWQILDVEESRLPPENTDDPIVKSDEDGK